MDLWMMEAQAAAGNACMLLTASMRSHGCMWQPIYASCSFVSETNLRHATSAHLPPLRQMKLSLSAQSARHASLPTGSVARASPPARPHANPQPPIPTKQLCSISFGPNSTLQATPCPPCRAPPWELPTAVGMPTLPCAPPAEPPSRFLHLSVVPARHTLLSL